MKRLLPLRSLCVVILLTGLLSAQEPGGDRDDPARGRMRHAAVEAYMRHLNEHDAEEHDRLATLRKSDPRAFEAAALASMKAKDWRPGPGGPPAGAPGAQHRGGMAEKALERLRQEDPAKYEELRDLRQRDPQAFREEIRKLFAGRQRDFYKQNEQLDITAFEREIRELVRDYQAAASDDDRYRTRAKLEIAIGRMLDAMTQAEEAKLEQLEKELDRMRILLEKRQELRERIIERRLDQLLKNAAEGAGLDAP